MFLLHLPPQFCGLQSWALSSPDGHSTLEFRQPVHYFIGYFTVTGAIYYGTGPSIGILQTQKRTIQADTRLDIEHFEFIRTKNGPTRAPEWIPETVYQHNY